MKDREKINKNKRSCTLCESHHRKTNKKKKKRSVNIT